MCGENASKMLHFGKICDRHLKRTQFFDWGCTCIHKLDGTQSLSVVTHEDELKVTDSVSQSSESPTARHRQRVTGSGSHFGKSSPNSSHLHGLGLHIHPDILNYMYHLCDIPVTLIIYNEYTVIIMIIIIYNNR